MTLACCAWAVLHQPYWEQVEEDTQEAPEETRPVPQLLQRDTTPVELDWIQVDPEPQVWVQAIASWVELRVLVLVVGRTTVIDRLELDDELDGLYRVENMLKLMTTRSNVMRLV